MTLLIMTLILAPFFSKRLSPEFLCLSSFIHIPLLWCSWSSLPVFMNIECLVDKLSAILMTLSIWTSILMSFLVSRDKFLNLNILILLSSLLGFFSTSSVLMFFVLFEASLIPTMCLIMGWGYQPERLEATYYFIFYTVLLSIPLLSCLVWLTMSSGTKYFYSYNLQEVCSEVMSFFILIVFLVKLPMFLVHFWLPKAHVEAPVVGSMILAGVLLKTGGYGIVRISIYMQKTLVSVAFMTLGLAGMVYVCLVCLYCADLKQVIAFSSVSHMNFMIVGLMNNSQTSFSGGIMMMVAHGLCSSLMFMLADLSYKRCSSRSMFVNKGFLMTMPPLAMLWGATVMFNMGVPPTAGSISELLIISTSSSSVIVKMLFGLYLFFSAFYSIYLYLMVNHGNADQTSSNISVSEAFVSSAHLVPLGGLTLLMKMML